jgi:hypothetical protein
MDCSYLDAVDEFVMSVAEGRVAEAAPPDHTFAVFRLADPCYLEAHAIVDG